MALALGDFTVAGGGSSGGGGFVVWIKDMNVLRRFVNVINGEPLQ